MLLDRDSFVVAFAFYSFAFVDSYYFSFHCSGICLFLVISLKILRYISMVFWLASMRAVLGILSRPVAFCFFQFFLMTLFSSFMVNGFMVHLSVCFRSCFILVFIVSVQSIVPSICSLDWYRFS